MKTSLRTLALQLLLFVPAASAANGPADGGGSLMMWLFLGFLGLVIVLQMVPGVTLFVGMIKGLFGSARSRVAPAKGDKA
jgi:hypothetical protein